MSEQALFAPASRKQELMFKAAMEAQITIIGGAAGSGKSYLLQLMPLLLIDDPKSNCIMFRRTTPQITGQGGIWDTAKGIFNSMPKDQKPHIREKALEAVFPKLDRDTGKMKYNGSKIKYQHMERENDKYNIQGLQFTFIGVDEACQFEWSQLEYMMSRLRSESKHFSRMVMSCNPDPDHQIRKIIDWHIDEDGYPIQERDGVIRYFIRRDGEFIWGMTKQDLYDVYGDKCLPLSFTFVSATVYDNPPMMENNPEYVAFLEGLNDVDKAQLLHGNWDARAKGANYFERKWLQDVPKLPYGTTAGRGYDLAATERSQVNKEPDATTGVKMHKCKDGYFYLVGNYCKEFLDEPTSVYGRVCQKVGSRDNIMAKQAAHDGSDCVIVLPVDPGAAGKQVYTEMAKKFANLGFRVKKDPVAGNKAKLTRFLPFADAAENGLIRIVRSTFDKATYEWIMKELESFDGERSTNSRKDDFPDAIATVYNWLCIAKVHKTYRIPTTGGATMLAAHKARVR